MSEVLEAPPRELSRVETLIERGCAFFNEGKLDPARLHFLAALALEPRNSSASQNLGAVLRNMRHYHAALVQTKRSVALTKGENPFCLTNHGVTLLGLRRHSEALKVLEGVVKKIPNAAPSWHNLGLAYYMMGKHQAALEAFEKSLSLAHNPHAASDRALTLLSLGKVGEGLLAYECRWEVLHRNRIFDLPIPEWNGEDLDGRHILVHHEQGFGDSIMLVRFLRQLAERHCHITLAVPPSLVRLFAVNYPFVTVVSLDDEDRINETTVFDFHSPLLSVMRLVGIKRPDDIDRMPYLMPTGPSPINLPPTSKRIGICWASGDHTPALLDRRRLVPLTLFLPLMEDVDVSLISLQKGADAKDIVTHGLEGIIFDQTHKLEDWADTANTIAELDLVISVDSAVAHLAGALGKPCLMLSPYTRCWRWWGLPNGSPWYSRMAAFSQTADGGWEYPMKGCVSRALWILKESRR